jgi:hypothetical protein
MAFKALIRDLVTGMITEFNVSKAQVDLGNVDNLKQQPINSIQHHYAGSTTEFTTTSSTGVIVTGMSFTPEAGTYLVQAFVVCERCSIGITSAGASVPETVRTVGNTSTPVGFMGKVTVNGSQVVGLAMAATSGTAKVNARSIMLTRIAP